MTAVRKLPAAFPSAGPAKPAGAAFAIIVLILVAVVSFLSGVFTMAYGTTVMHQILSAVQFLIFTVALAGIGIISAVTGSRQTAAPQA
jgi:protein-S-isoprenylcysteine O-methyltransferase Ste14